MIRNREKYEKEGRLVLTKGEKFWHYSTGLFFFALGLFFFCMSYFSRKTSGVTVGKPSLENLLTTHSIFMGIALLIILIKYRNLRFKMILGVFTTEQVKEALRRASIDYEWKALNNNQRLIKLRAPIRFIIPEKLITIIHDDDKILFNGIRFPNYSPQRGETFIPSFREYRIFKNHLVDVCNGVEFKKRIEFNENQWSWQMILIRLFLYPFCFFLLWISVHMIVEMKQPFLAFFTIPLCIIYFYADFRMIRRHIKDKK